MTPELSLIVLALAMAVLLLSGLWTAFALGIAGMVVIVLNSGSQGFEALGSIGWNLGNDFILTAVPLFLLMGQMILVSGLSEKFVLSVELWFRGIPGGLLPGSIFASGVFAATTGSSVATAAAVGTVALPDMKRRGYSLSLSAGSIAAGGTLGVLIPPSIPLILYGAMTSTSIATLFAVAIVPGVALVALFILYVIVRTLLSPSLTGRDKAPFELGPALRSSAAMVPVFLLIGLVLGTIYAGVATPTEAAAIGAAGATLLAARRLNLHTIRTAVVRTVETTTMVLAIMLGAQILSYAVVDSGANRALTDWIIASDFSPTVFLLVLFALYIVLGAFLDGVSMMLLTLPLLLPVIVSAGLDPVWFGILLVLFIELGQITPPVGLNLFVLEGLDKDVSHSMVSKGVLPFVGIIVAMASALAIFPELLIRF